MICPNCQSENNPLSYGLDNSRDRPATCQECGSKYYVRRLISNVYLMGFWYSGIGFIALLLVYLRWSFLGLVIGIVSSVFLHYLLLWVENKIFTPKIFTSAEEKSGNRYLLVARTIVGVAIAVFVYFTFFHK